MLTDAQMARLYSRCKDHYVARCAECRASYKPWDLGLDILSTPHDLVCPRCRADLSAQVLDHVVACARFATPAHAVQREESGDRIEASLREAPKCP